MIDHVLGRPSIKSRRLQVLAVLAVWTAYLVRGNKNGPPGARSLSRLLSRKLTAWQVVLVTMLYLYASRNFSTLVGLASPDPLTNMYDPSFFRATWVLTALDAGFWTAMKIRTPWLRDLASLVFSGFYLVATEKADEKVRKVRGNITVEHLRVSWNKGTTPYIRFLQGLTRPRLTRWPPRLLRIPRPAVTADKNSVLAWLYYDGSLEQLRMSGIDRVVLDIPGGGFVAMDPRCNDDRLLSWAVTTGLPVLSLDYRKAPEYPFPYALNECYDAYATLVHTRGRCIGLAGEAPVRVVVTGDSAGGNLAAAMTLMLAQQQSQSQSRTGLPLPDGLVLVYPCLDVNIGNWMSDEQMALMQDRRTRATNRNVLRRKVNQFSVVAGTPHDSDAEGEDDGHRGLTMTPAVRARDKTDSGAHDEDGDANADAGNDNANDDDELVHGERSRSAQPAYAHVNTTSYSRPQTPAVTKTSMDFPSPTLGDDSASAPAAAAATAAAPYRPAPMSTRVATSSTISYFNDRVLTPEMMRAMIILYIGPHNRPDFAQDYLLSPILAPDLLLAHFPKTFFLTGERDPLVDDTVLFAGRLRRVKMAYYASGGRRVAYRESDAARVAEDGGFDDRRDVAEVVLIPGVSHGFLQFPAVYPPAWQWIQKSAHWVEEAFAQADERRAHAAAAAAAAGRRTDIPTRARRGRPVSRAQTSSMGAVSKKKDLQLNLALDALEAPGNGLPKAAPRPESSGDEAPLEMMRMTKGKAVVKEEKKETAPARQAQAQAPAQAPTDKPKKHKAARRAAEDSSLVKLKSTDDLLGRRMQGIVGSLSGVTEE